MTLQATGSSKQRQIWFNDITVLVKPLKTILLQNDGGVWGDDPDSDEDTIVLRSTEQKVSGEWNIENPARRKLSLTEVKKAVLKSGDLLLTKSSGSASHIGKTSLVNEYVENLSACYSNFMQRLRLVEGVNPKYVYYFLNNELARQQFTYLSNTTTGLSNLNAEIIGSIQIPVPDDKTQNLIVAYLDKQTAKIDSLVKEKQNFIDFLKEKRQALICHYVTKGLVSNVPMKDSGVEWIGMVPGHWKVIPLKLLTSKIGSGKTPSGGAEVYEDSGITFLRSQNIYDGELRLDDVVYISEAINSQMLNSSVRAGDILLNITGGSIGRSCTYPDNGIEANVNQHVCIIRMRNSAYRDFIGFLMQSPVIKAQVDFLQTGAGREGLNFEQIGKFVVTLPPVDEVGELVDTIRENLSELNHLITEIDKSIDLLKERRTALIGAAVTGKIDVLNYNKTEAI